MATVIRADGQKVELDQIVFDDQNSTFRLSDESGEFEYDFKYVLQKAVVDHEYEVHLLFRKNIKNEEISELIDKESESRIGWSFPVEALTTSDHSFAENEHFLRTAFGAYRQILKTATFSESDATSDQYLDKLLFLDPDTVIVCLFRTFIDTKLPGFDFRDYYPALYRFGITTEKTENLSDFSDPLTDRLSLAKISQDLKGEEFVGELFATLIYEPHYLARFVVLYQIIELCLERILLRELDNLTDSIRKRDIYVRDIRAKLESFESEKKRINKLFTDYQRKKNDYIRDQLKNVSDTFLESIGLTVDKSVGFPDTFYSVRNTIFHNFRGISKGLSHINTINDLFSHLVSDLVMTYDERTPPEGACHASDSEAAETQPRPEIAIEAIDGAIPSLNVNNDVKLESQEGDL
jgi:hypothetical protein